MRQKFGQRNYGIPDLDFDVRYRTGIWRCGRHSTQHIHVRLDQRSGVGYGHEWTKSIVMRQLELP